MRKTDLGLKKTTVAHHKSVGYWQRKLDRPWHVGISSRYDALEPVMNSTCDAYFGWKSLQVWSVVLNAALTSRSARSTESPPSTPLQRMLFKTRTTALSALCPQGYADRTQWYIDFECVSWLVSRSATPRSRRVETDGKSESGQKPSYFSRDLMAYIWGTLGLLESRLLLMILRMGTRSTHCLSRTTVVALESHRMNWVWFWQWPFWVDLQPEAQLVK